MSLYRSFPEIVTDIRRLRSEGWSFEQIGDAYGVNKGTIWKMLKEGKEPQDTGIRKRLKLPPVAEVEFIEQLRYNGQTVQIQALQIRICCCGQHFIPNTAKRLQCFTCEPFRSRKPLDQNQENPPDPTSSPVTG